MYVCVCIGVYAYVCVREREKERESERDGGCEKKINDEEKISENLMSYWDERG